jgi:hypothetical protein
VAETNKIQLPNVNTPYRYKAGKLERAMGIEPTAPAWEAGVLPLYDARMRRYAGAVWHKNQRGFKHLCHCNGAAGEQFSKRLTAQAGWQRCRERSTTVAFGLHIHGSQAEKRPENRPEDLYLKIVACLIVGLTEHRQHRIRPVKASPVTAVPADNSADQRV